MRRIAIINQKGGVGKTTTTANVGAALAMSGKRVLLVDLDPQAHLTLHYGVELAEHQVSVYDVMTSSTPVREVAVETRERIAILPADIDLAGAEVELISITGREVILREALAPVDADYDYLLIDCPPSLGVLTINALSACDDVLIPLQAQFFALQGLGKLLDTVTLVRQRINPKLSVMGVALCMHDKTTRLSGEVVDDLSGFLERARGTDVPWADARVYTTRIRRNIKLAESSSYGQTVLDYDPKSNGARDYASLTAEAFGVANPLGGQAQPTPIEARSTPRVRAAKGRPRVDSDKSESVGSAPMPPTGAPAAAAPSPPPDGPEPAPAPKSVVAPAAGRNGRDRAESSETGTDDDGPRAAPEPKPQTTSAPR